MYMNVGILLKLGNIYNKTILKRKLQSFLFIIHTINSNFTWGVLLLLVSRVYVHIVHG